MFKKCKEQFKPDQNAIDDDEEIPEEPEYRNWWTREYFLDNICDLSQNGVIMSLFCLMVLRALLRAITQVFGTFWVDDWYDPFYTVVVVSLAVNAARRYPGEPVTWFIKVGFLLDIVSYLHYLPYYQVDIRIVCFFIRLHRPMSFIWIKDRDTINSNLLVTTLKYFYYTALLRVICTYFWILIIAKFYRFDVDKEEEEAGNARQHLMRLPVKLTSDIKSQPVFNPVEFLSVTILVLNKVFLPIGPEVLILLEDIHRVLVMVVVIIGTLMVTGAVVASLSSVVSVYMRPEENFRTRHRIIMNDLTQSAIPQSLRNKVETFYKMYWHKQRAVSASQLLPSFSPVLPNSVYTDVYFEATQKSGLLRDLSYLFLSELARQMETVFYIPGDCIIKRNSLKDSIIFITYGDVEMLTAEDDSSAMLRFTRGTILTPWGGCAAGGGRAHVQLRAGTFCVARVLRARGLWRVALRYGRDSQPSQTRLMLAELRDHMNKVKIHYAMRGPKPTQYKSSILEFKKSLMALKEARGEDGELLLGRPDYLLEIAGCYLMRNRADATLTNDSDPICLRQTFPCILQPTSSLLTTWNWLVTCLILVVCLIYPYHIIYIKTIPLEFRLFDIMVVAIFLLDIVVYLSTGTNVEEGVPITFIETASKQVMSVWFFVDVLATAPIFTFIGDGNLAGINRVFRITKVIRMILSLEEECVYHTEAIRFFVCFLLLFFSCYFLAAVQQYYICYSFGYCVVTNFTHSPFWSQAPLDDVTVDDRLFFSMYWAISLLTFTCHMNPVILDVNYKNQLIFAMIMLEICIWLSIAIEAVYSATIMVTTAFREGFDSCIEDAQRFLDIHQLPLQLRQRFIEHLQLCWNTRKAYVMSTKQTSAFYDLPAHVYQDILARQRSRFLLCVPFMKLLRNEYLKNVSANVRMFNCAPNEILLNTGDISTDIYIIKKGFCEVLNPDTKEVVAKLAEKSHFGVLECLFRLPAFYTVRSTTHVMVISISKKYLLEALKVPQIKDAIKFAKKQEEYSRLQVRREAFVSYQPPPRVSNREHFKLPRRHLKDAAFLQPFKKFGFFAILRNVFPRFTFRPDSALLTRYELCRSFCAFVGASIFPGYTYMVLQLPALYYVTLLLDLSAYADIILRMFVGFFDARGILVYHPANTAAHYLRGAFVLDLLGCLPLEELEVSMKYSYGHLYQVTAIKQVLMLNRLLQLYRLPGTMDMLTTFLQRGDIILVLKSLPLFMTLLNVMTTLLVFSSVRIYHSEDDSEWALVPFDDPGGSWINLYRDVYRFNVTATPWTLHLGCYFWIVYEATTTGYNTLAPTNLHIMSVLFWTMVLGSLMTIYMSVRIISLRARVNSALADYQERMKDLVQFMQQENLDNELQREIINHYEFNWEKTDGIDARDVLKLCDLITLRSDAILHLYGPAFTKCPILSNSNVSLFRILGRAVHSIYFLEGTTIFQEDDVIHHLYFVYSGCVQLRTSHWDKGLSKVTKLGIGSMVGNLDDTPSIRVSSSLVAATDVQLLRMRGTLFHNIVHDCFPETLQLMAVHRHGNELFINGNSDSHGRPSKLHVTEVNKRLAITSGIVQIFLIITSLLCVYTDLYNAGFQNNSVPILVALYFLDVCFLVKFLLYLTLPRLVTLPLENHETAKEKYFKSMEFILDVASCAPIELFCFCSSSTDLWLLLSWLRLNRMLRVLTVSKYLKRYEKRATENLVFRTTTLVMWFTVYIHCVTCIWFYIGLSKERTQPKQSWQYNKDGVALCQNKYICSVYFVLTSFAHNGIADIMPRTQIEVLYVSGLLIISRLMFMVYLGEFSNIVQYASFRAFSYYSKYVELQSYMKNNRVSPVLVKIVNKYAVWLWHTARGEQTPEFLLNSPFCLKLKIMNHTYKNFGEKHPVFQNCEPALLRHIVCYLRQYYYDENMYVVKQGEITNSMYLVRTGEVQEISESYEDDEDEGVNRRVYTEGELIGVEQGLIRDKPFDYSYRTTMKSKILTLVLDDWEYLLNHFPDSKKLIVNYPWSTGGDDDDKDKARYAAGPPPSPGPDTSTTLGPPGGSESLQHYRGGPPDKPPDGPPDTPPRKRPDTSSKPEDADTINLRFETKRASYTKATRAYNSDDLSLIDDRKKISQVKRESKAVKLKDDIQSSTDLICEKRKSALRTADKTFKSKASVKFDIGESLTASSSTQLFERIHNTAKHINNRLASQSKQDNDDTPSQKVTASAPHHSIEEYLAYKFKMRESYAYHPKREDNDDIDTDVQMSSSCSKTHAKYSNADLDGSGREHFTHPQLAESTHRMLSIQSQNVPVLNLERPFGDNTTSFPSFNNFALASNVDLQPRKSLSSSVERVDSPVAMTSKQAKKQSNAVDPKSDEDTKQFYERAIDAEYENIGDKTFSRRPPFDKFALTSNLDLQQKKSLLSSVERVDSQVPMTSKQAKKQSSAVDPKSDEDIDQFYERALDAEYESKPVNRSNINPIARTHAATELLALPGPSDIIEQEPPEFQNTADPETSTSPTIVLPSVPTPSPLASVEHALPEAHTPKFNVTLASLVDKLKESLAKLHLNLFPMQPPALQLSEHALSEIQTLTEADFTERERSTIAFRFLEAVQAQPPIMAPPEDQATDLGALSAANLLLNSVQPNKITQPDETTPTENQRDDKNPGTDSEGGKGKEDNTEASKPGQDKLDKEETDQDGNSKERKEKKD